MAMADAGSVKPAGITKVVRITGGLLKRNPWVVENVQIVDGVEMLPLVKGSVGFGKFVSGDRHGLARMDFLDRMRQMRLKATIEACNDGLFEVPTNDVKAFRAQKKKWQMDGVPGLVEVKLPAIDGYPSRYVKVQSSLDIRTLLWVELNADVLDHIAVCMRMSCNEDHQCRVKVGPGVRWSKSRKCYMARRANKRMKIFRADPDASDEDIALDDARNEALAWAERDTDDEHGLGDDVDHREAEGGSEEVEGGSDADTEDNDDARA